jgi:diaminopimelate epimerase
MAFFMLENFSITTSKPYEYNIIEVRNFLGVMHMLSFEKLHGTGNDFIVFNGIKEKLPDLSTLARKVCDRHFGIGADGILVAMTSEIADVRMVYYNSDGSEAPMCGNGIRCFAKYVYENKIVEMDQFRVETMAGIMVAHLLFRGKKVEKVRINMGKPSFLTKDFPITTTDETFVNKDIKVLERTFKLTALNMGTIHAVVFTDSLDDLDVRTYGPLIENLSLFPKRTNVNFCKVIDEHTLRIITWERGAGLTLACGTGSCACAVASSLINHTGEVMKVLSPGGELLIEKINEDVYLTGEAKMVCKGYYNDEGVL